MKKLFIFFTAVVLIAISANLYAQSTGTTPAPGATHEYFITPGNSANNIEWTVYENDFSTVATDATIDDNTAATTDITWASTVTPGTWYYVQVIETDGEGCSNTKVLPVQITESDFFLELSADEATACYNNAVSVSIVSNAPQYDHGTATIDFTVTPSNLSASYTGYTFDLALTVPSGFSSTPTFSANASWDGTTVTVTDNSLVTISFEVDNGNTYDNSSAADAQDFTATAAISNGQSANGVSENDTANDNTDATNVSRPNTSGIGTN